MNFNKIIFLANTDFIFKIDNFLDQEEYFELYNNFPPAPDTNNNSNKNFYNSRDKNFSDIINLNPVFIKFNSLIMQRKFKDFFIETLFFKVLKYKVFYKKYLLKFLFNKIFNNIDVTYQFSYMPNNSFLSPHVDSNNKILSLMLYFPEAVDNKIENFENKQSIIGTSFYDYPYNNFNNEEINDLCKINKFYKESKKILTTKFEPLTLYGFIKTPKSWHAVEKFDISQNYIRKSININIRIN